MTPGVDTLPRSVRAIESDDAALTALIEAGEPAILKGLVADWPLVRAARWSPALAAEELLRFYRGAEVVGYIGEPHIRGRFHYDDSVTGMNFRSERMRLDGFLRLVLDHVEEAGAPAHYLGSTDIDTYLPGLRAENDLRPSDGTFDHHAPFASIWIGNRTVAATHYDMSNNAACCIAGRRRFTLFPPDQIANLYPGPLAPTPGGQVVSMVDIVAPDLDRYPRFREAMAHALVADLEPGDVLVYPALWWHNVEALDGSNILINYWWNVAPPFADTPMDSVLHAMLSLRDRPAAEKAAWREVFDYYVFGEAERAAQHLPAPAQGPLAPLTSDTARRLRAYLLSRLNR
jgi:hypothetical protein